MRLTSDIWVSALVRRVFGAGGFAAVERRGAPEAGAIFVRVRHRDGTQILYGPAPQSVFDSEKPQDRVFEMRCITDASDEIAAALDRELRFDRDLWVVEIEVERIDDYLTIMPA
ncbi:DUF1491 family protein [Pararhizobium haloflavum]|uniref:DUF1491 family protein n=1 Tax=Pararhizobium haloflavum TaxID=2037914 RepID=UPI000C1A096F|nr:DUF1491 family protein [Pararhizobium haloflavum]